MNKYDLMDAMGGIDERYLKDACRAAEGAGKAGQRVSSNRHLRKFRYIAAAAAAALALSVILPNTSAGTAYAMQNIPVLGGYFRAVTFRDWSYSDDTHDAEVHVEGVTVDSAAGADSTVSENASRSAKLTNEQIAAKTDSLIAEFKEKLAGEGYASLDVSTQVVTDSSDYYVLRLTAFQAAADGYEENCYYVLSKNTGEIVHLKDLFRDGSDYVGVISSYLIDTMKQEMKEDPEKMYFVGDPDDPAEYKGITADQQFYIDGDGHLVISMNEGEAAPMYMGALTFTIPDEVIAGIRK